jgi:CubicO group peptidase (beta-lactamase class C family)
MAFEAAMTRLVLEPAGLTNTTFRPNADESTAPTEFCPWRRRRIRGEVHDKNAAAMGGAAGHAGLFGTAIDVAALGQILLTGGAPLLSPAIMTEAIGEQAADSTQRRGLGFLLRCPASEASQALGPAAFGHHGFTGTSLWVDPDADLVIALLTNWVHGGREDRGFASLCASIHREVARRWV